MKVSLSGPAYRGRAAQAAYLQQVLERLAGAPGVAAAGVGNAGVRGFAAAEGVVFAPNQAPESIFHTVSAGYFRALGMRLAAGRWLADGENQPAVLVNESFARRVFGVPYPLGRRVRTGSSGMNVNESGASMPRDIMAPIVGVVADLRYSRLDAEPMPEVYVPYTQSTSLRSIDILVRAAGDPAAVSGSARALVAGVDPNLPVYGVETLEEALAASIAPRRFQLLLLGAFALSALALALIGIYGVMTYAVAQRTQEIGVRMALGAGRGEVVRMVVRQGMLTAGAGMAAGIAAAFGLTRLIRGLLYEVTPADPWTFAAVAGALGAAVLAACWLPARRAAAVDPALALRYE
jgi:putative ABC transport system permease protein